MNNSRQDEPPGSNHTPAIPLLTRCIATGFFSGYIPWASGTFGTLVGLLFFAIPGFAQPLPLSLAIIAGFAAGVYASARVAEVEGHRLSRSAQMTKDRFQHGVHETPDPSIVVIDEIVGMWIAMFALPSFSSHPVTTAACAFVAFRVFDIIKPYPARQVERYSGGWGIMMDDAVAGIYANIATRVLLAVLLNFFSALP